MEAAGLSVGLLGLIDSCISAYDKVDAYREYGVASQRLQTRFENQRYLLEQFQAGLADSGDEPSLEGQTAMLALDQKRRRRIEETLKRIRDYLKSHGASAVGAKAGKSSRWTKLKWAAGENRRLAEEVEWFAKSVQDLSKMLFPASGPPRDVSSSNVTKSSGPTSASMDAVKSWLGSKSSRSILDQLQTARTGGTCQWIFQLPAYKQFLDPEGKQRMFWLHAPPGYGKSVTAATIAERLMLERPDSFACFFCSASSEALRQPSNIIRSLLTQAMLGKTALFRLAESARAQSDSQIASDSELFALLSEALNLDNGLTILLDGFDECDRFETELHKRNGFDRGLFLERLRKSIVNTPSRLFLISRDEYDIRSAIVAHGSPDTPQAVIEHSISRTNVQGDIELFAKEEVDDKFSMKHESLRKEIWQGLTDHSEGMFLWIRLQSLRLKGTAKGSEIRRQLTTTPPDLEALYEQAWDRIQSLEPAERDHTILILRWVTCAARPMDADELLEAAAITMRGDACILDAEYLPETAMTSNYIQSELIERCRPFLSVQYPTNDASSLDCGNANVQLAHFTMKQFLGGRLHGKTSIDSSLSYDNELATACLGYLTWDSAWSGGTRSVPSPDPSVSWMVRPFLSYAVMNWMNHLDPSEPSISSSDSQLHHFFIDADLYWYRWRYWYEDVIQQENPAYLGHDVPYIQEAPGNKSYFASLFGLLGLLWTLVIDEKYDVNASSGRVGSALQAACRSGHQKVVEFLLDNNADVNIYAGLQGCALNCAASHGDEEILRVLLARGADTGATDDFGRSALFTAAEDGSETAVKCLIAAGAPLNKTVNIGGTPLIAATCGAHSGIAKRLLDAGADCTAADDFGSTALHMASNSANLELVQVLLKAGASVHVADSGGLTAIHLASNSGNADVVKALLQKGADVLVADQSDVTPLHHASCSSSSETVDLLLQAGADVNAVDKSGWTPIHGACQGGSVKIVEALLRAGAKVDALNFSNVSPLHVACQSGVVPLIELLIRSGAQKDQADSDGMLPLHVAAEQGFTDVVKLLLDRGCDVNCLNGVRATSVLLASRNGFLPTVERLCKAGADVTMVDDIGWRPLSVAAENGSTALVEFLLKQGADPNAASSAHSALYAAVKDGDTELTAMLIKAGARNDLDEQYQLTPLDFAIQQGHSNLVQYIWETVPSWFPPSQETTKLQLQAAKSGKLSMIEQIEGYGYSMKITGEDGDTTLHAAAWRGNEEALEYLINKGFEVNATTKSDRTPLHTACERGNAEAARLLFLAGSSESLLTEKGSTPLGRACAKGRAETVRALVQAGANIELRDRKGFTPLHAAVRHDKLAVVDVLLELGADISARTVKRGRTPEDLAFSKGYDFLGYLLKDYWFARPFLRPHIPT